MELSKEKLAPKFETFREILASRREALATSVRQATQDAIDEDESYADSVDQASAVTDKALFLQIKNRDRDQILQIDEALRRLDTGTFGECERCGESISEARLKAFPLTTLCIDCKAELESEQNRFPGRD